MTRWIFWTNAVLWLVVSFGGLAFCVQRKGVVPKAIHWLALTVAVTSLVALETALRGRLRDAGWPPALVGWALFSVAIAFFLVIRLGVPPWLAWAPAALFALCCVVGALCPSVSHAGTKRQSEDWKGSDGTVS